MKKMLFLMSPFLLLLLLMQFGCSHKMTPTVAKNVDLSADFKDIKSYSWTADIDKIPSDKVFVGPNGVIIFNNESGRKLIKDAIQYELDSRGYKRVETGADMLVSFSVFEQPATLRTTNGYATLSTGEKVRTEDNVSYTDVKPGTLIINLINAEKNKQIWQGFVSGILKPVDMRDQSKVRQAVSTIFSQFKYNNNM